MQAAAKPALSAAEAAAAKAAKAAKSAEKKANKTRTEIELLKAMKEVLKSGGDVAPQPSARAEVPDASPLPQVPRVGASRKSEPANRDVRGSALDAEVSRYTLVFQ